MKSKFILNLACPDRLGIVAKVCSILAMHGGNILSSSQYGDTITNTFFMRCFFEIDEALITVILKKFNNEFLDNYSITPESYKPKAVIMVTKDGTCLNHLLYKSQQNVLPIEVVSVISNHNYLRPLAEAFKVPFYHFPIENNKKVQETQIYEHFQQHKADLLILARYMQILSPEITKKFYGKAINIHHSFLPSFKGAKPYHQAFTRGVKLIGATAHYITDELDEGPIIEQEVARVNHSLDIKQLINLGAEIESQVLIKAVKYHAEKRVFLNGIKTVVLN
jgi:formyltetrahydrofolate deformylase